MIKTQSDLSSTQSEFQPNIYLVWRDDTLQTTTPSCVEILIFVKAYQSIETILAEIRQEGGVPIIAGAPISESVPVSFLEPHFRCERLDLLVQFEGAAVIPLVRYTIVRKLLTL